jgi:hypothetical protein
MTSAVLAAAVLALLPLVARGQPPQPTVTSPESHLIDATRLVGDLVAPPDRETAAKIATLQTDFSDLATAYLGPPRREAAGTTGVTDTTGAPTGVSNWQGKFGTVERDLSALIGPAGARSDNPGVSTLDGKLRRQLQEIRGHLQLFYAGAMGLRSGNPVGHTGSTANTETPVPAAVMAPQTPPQSRPLMQAAAPTDSPSPAQQPPATPTTQGASAVSVEDRATILVLLDRIEGLVDATLDPKKSPTDAPVGTSGKSSGKSGRVLMDRATLDEIRAEVAQIKTMLAKP